MPTAEKRNVTLAPELAAAVDEAVASGEYGNASEVIDDALSQWKASRELHGYSVEELRRLWEEGVDSGKPRPFTADAVREIQESGRKRLAEQRKGS